MKVSNSKKELARIISENGGWRDGCDFVVQDKDSFVCFYEGKPTRCGDSWKDKGDCQYRYGFNQDGTIQNWHQSILSRSEYLSLYPAPDAKPQFCDSVKRSIPEPEIHSKNMDITQVDDINVVELKPTIEQLVAEYRNAKNYAERKQEEADAAKSYAEAKLAELVAAGKELGLVPVSAVKPAIDGCMQLVDMVPTRLQSHQEESVAAIGHVVNVERLYDKVRDVFDLLK